MSNKHSKQKGSTTKQKTSHEEIKPRNPVATHPLLKKSHAHEKPLKSHRSKDKQALRKQLRENSED